MNARCCFLICDALVDWRKGEVVLLMRAGLSNQWLAEELRAGRAAFHACFLHSRPACSGVVSHEKIIGGWRVRSRDVKM